LKNFIVGIALIGFAFGCRSDKNASVSDPAAANMPKAECCAKKSECTDAQKAECQKKASCCQKADATPQN
jgi:hypothetical protein